MDEEHIRDYPRDDRGQLSTARRRRPALSCSVCRRRKLKCDRSLPCGQCVKSKTPDLCVYSGPSIIQNPGPRPVPAESSPPDHAPSDRHSPARTGLYVFDSRHQNVVNRIAKPRGRPDELQELRSRVQSLEHALTRTGSIQTPESLGYDSISELGSRTVLDTQAISQEVRNLSERACFRGRDGRTRFRGRSSVELTLSSLSDMVAFLSSRGQNLKSEGSEYQMMKKFRGELRSRENLDQQKASQGQALSLKEMLPPRNVADELLKLYLSTFETTHRILHIPTFQQQYEAYWADPEAADTVFVAKLLALMAASGCFFSPATTVNGTDTLHDVAVGWILAVQSWVASFFVSATIKFDMLQIQCLLMIARQAMAADGDVVWITSGSLIRSAMSMGMHRNPLRFPKMTHFWAEMRRRLWATILELDLQASVDAAVQPSIDLDQYDCDPPSNCDDSDLTEDMPEGPVSRDGETMTQCSFQTILARSFPLRLRIAKAVNSLKFTLSYDEALRVSEDLVQFMNEALAHFPLSTSDDGSPSFARSFMLFLMQRSLLVLHRPFLLSISLSPKFSYSRKVCVESSLEMLSHFESPITGLQGTQTRPCLAHMRGGMFRNEYFHAALTVCAELYLQNTECSTSKSSTQLSSLSDLVRSQQDVLMRVVERTIETMGSRISPRGSGCKAFAFLSMALAGVKARMNGEEPMKKIEEASVRAIKACHQIIRGASWDDIRGRPESDLVPSSTHTPVSSGTSDGSFDPLALFSSNPIDFSPLDFNNMFDASFYKMPEIWDPNFLTL